MGSPIARRVVLGALLLVLLVAVPASAHPYVEGGGEVPVDSLVTIVLHMAHGCESEDEGAGQDTTEVALQVPEWLRVVDVSETEPWDVELETAPDDDTLVEAVTWLTDDPQEPAPAFELDVVASGEAGEERYLAVFQGCDEGSYRWVGTPDEPAEDPAVRVQLVAPDPDAPPPPGPDTVEEGGTDGGEADDDEGARPADADGAPEEQEPSDEDGNQSDPPLHVEDAAGIEGGGDGSDEDGDGSGTDVPDLEETSGGASVWIVVIAVLLVLLAVGAALAVRARRRAGDLDG